MKNGSSSKIFAGLLLVFFNINLYHLNILTAFIGTMLLTTAAWQLGGINNNLKSAFNYGIVQLILQVANLILVCLQLGSNPNIAIAICIVGTLIMIVLLYHLFSGLELIVIGLGHGELVHKLQLCCPLYVGLSLLNIFSVFIIPLIYLEVPVALIIIIYILAEIYKVKQIIDQNSDSLQERKPGIQYAAITGCCFVFVVILCMAALLYKNCPAIHTEIYSKNDCIENLDIQSIKNNLLAIGFDKEALDDLPDSEVKNYQNVLSVHNTKDQQQTDGGMLQVITTVSYFEKGASRYLVYYKWLKLPRHKFCDSFDVTLPINLVVLPNKIDFNCFGIYDKKTPDSVITWKANFVNCLVAPPLYPRMTYRVLGDGTINQRGFFAFNGQMSMLLETNYNIIINYFHQRTLFNLDNTHNNQTDQQQMTIYNEDFAYDRIQFLTEENYKP